MFSWLGNRGRKGEATERIQSEFESVNDIAGVLKPPGERVDSVLILESN